jgi:hypothetical protein
MLPPYKRPPPIIAQREAACFPTKSVSKVKLPIEIYVPLMLWLKRNDNEAVSVRSDHEQAISGPSWSGAYEYPIQSSDQASAAYDPYIERRLS